MKLVDVHVACLRFECFAASGSLDFRGFFGDGHEDERRELDSDTDVHDAVSIVFASHRSSHFSLYPLFPS